MTVKRVGTLPRTHGRPDVWPGRLEKCMEHPGDWYELDAVSFAEKPNDVNWPYRKAYYLANRAEKPEGTHPDDWEFTGRTDTKARRRVVFGRYCGG